MASLTLPRESLLAVRHPRVDWHAPYSATFGPEATELYAQTGQALEPWQADAMDPMLAYRPGGKWTHFEHCELVSRQCGKGCIGEARVLSGLMLFDERLIMWSAHQYKTAKEAFRRILALVESNDELSRRLKRVSRTHGEEGLEFNGQGRNRVTGEQRLLFLARSEKSGRGMTGDCNVIDEALALTFDQLGALLFTVSARPNPQFLYLSSPPLDTDSDLVLFTLKQRAEAGDDLTLSYRDWGLPGTLADLGSIDFDDRALWYESNPALGGRITEEQVARERNTLRNDPKTFARERLGIWPPAPVDKTDVGAIPAAVWAALIDPDSQSGPDVAFAVDIEPNRRNASIAAFSLRPDGRGHVELVAHRPGVAWIVPALVKLKALHRPVAIALDSKGPAGSLITPLAAAGIRPPEVAGEPMRGDLAIMRTNDVSDAWGQFLDAVADDADAIRHRDQVQLTAAVSNAKTRKLGEAEALTRRTATGDISPLVAAVAARWSYFDRIDRLVPDEADPGAWVL